MLQTRHVDNFKKIVGDDNFSIDKAHMLAYSYDATR
ncbi:MAG: hypothetical protein QG567_73, partial [Campylobacterota bacterium]|nr:hypothetical protein [Campylobacterota bacterium]